MDTRNDRHEPGPLAKPRRVWRGRRTRALLAAALALVGISFLGCRMVDEADDAAAASAPNWDFEAGEFRGWHTTAKGSGAWHVYRDGAKAPDPAESDPNVPFAVPDPPEGQFAAITDMRAPGARILYRDLRLDGHQRLRVTLFYDNHAAGRFFTPRTLAFEGCTPNQQFRIDVLDPSAPIDAVGGRAILATLFRTAAGDPAKLDPSTRTFDLSRWAGRTVRLRFAEVDNQGPLRAGVDDVRLEPLR
jgi:hypothetical protein